MEGQVWYCQSRLGFVRWPTRPGSPGWGRSPGGAVKLVPRRVHKAVLETAWGRSSMALPGEARLRQAVHQTCDPRRGRQLRPGVATGGQQ